MNLRWRGTVLDLQFYTNGLNRVDRIYPRLQSNLNLSERVSSAIPLFSRLQHQRKTDSSIFPAALSRSRSY